MEQFGVEHNQGLCEADMFFLTVVFDEIKRFGELFGIQYVI